MKNSPSIWLIALSLLAAHFTARSQQPALIPQPVMAEKTGAPFELLEGTGVLVPANQPELLRLGEQLARRLHRTTGLGINVYPEASAPPITNKIVLELTGSRQPGWGEEGYSLETGPGLVRIRANAPAGIFYGMQTLLQLFPPEIESATAVAKRIWQAPGFRITDFPRFAWRGMMLDVSRHFFSKAAVMRFIDDMARYKYNRLHWHLTDDQGWRIEIKSLPRLTEVGAWRVPRVGRMSRMTAPGPGEARTYGGFYTQEDIREIVAYARERYVEIMPEIDVPGHSMAAKAAYPDLGCTPGETYQVNSGEKFMEWPAGKHFYALIDNVLCPANEKVYQFLDQVFTEVAALFPFEYIHMGGDETARNFWEKSAAIKALMAREKLKDLNEVQSYFVKRVQKIIAAKGKKLMGWDEILDGGLAPNAAVMSWRGEKGGIEASRLQHPVVMTPASFVYLDYNQGDAYLEPPIYASLRLSKTYQFDPVPSGADARWILGGQGNLWTEQVTGLRSAQYMAWPRGLAIAEAVWSPRGKRNWNDFVARAEAHFPRLDAANTKYARTIYDPIITARKGSNGAILIEMASEIEGLSIHYSFDETHPDCFYPQYQAPVEIPKDAIHLKVISCREGKIIGRQIDLPVEELRKRAGIR